VSEYIDYEHVTKEMKRLLPVIEGVEWDVAIDRNHHSISHRILVVAKFEVDTREGLVNKLPEVSKKIHEITCGGQIKLELE
jgi:hypothetical protein